MTQFAYTVTYRREDLVFSRDITEFVERVEIVDIGTGEIRSLIMRLNAQDGQFITRSTQQGTGADTPIVDQFDMFEVTIVDQDLDVFRETFEVSILKPIQNTQQGTVLECQCLGRESYLMKNTFTKQFRFASGFDVSRDIIDFYNDSVPKNLPVLNPTIIGNKADTADGGHNDIPTVTSNHYMFAVSELTHYDAMDQTIDKMAAPVSSGGAGNFFEHHYRQDDETPAFNNLIFEGFESGNPPAQQVDNANDQFKFDPSKSIIISDSQAVNPGEEEGGIETLEANQVGVWGQDGSGRLPFENGQFNGELELWLNVPVHQPTEFYPADSLVQVEDTVNVEGDNEHFQALVDTTTTPPGVDWIGVTFSGFSTFDEYSKWTNKIEASWRNSCGNPNLLQGSSLPEFANSLFDQLTCWDGNLLVVDVDFNRSYTDIRAVNLAVISDNWKRGGFGGKLYRGFRILVDTTLGTPVGALANFANDLVQVEKFDENGDEVFIKVREYNDGEFCAVDAEALVAQGDGGRVFQLISGVWTDISQNSLLFPNGQSNDCYHPVWQVRNSQGWLNRLNFQAGENFGLNSAVTFEFRYTSTDFVFPAGVFDFTNTNYYRAGAWCNFKFPFPQNSYNSQSIGSLYGNNDDKVEPATLDQYNMHLTPSGLVGFNNSEADNLGVLDGLYFYTKFLLRAGWDNDAGQVIEGNFKCRCYLYDTNDTCVSQDFTIPFQNLWEPISLPFADFKIYRARKPASLTTTITDPFLQGLEVVDIFRYENIKRFCFVWLTPYDDQGRYHPAVRSAELIKPFNPIGAPPLEDIESRTIEWSFDYFGFSKSLLSVTAPITSGRLLQTIFFQEPLIDNKAILDQTSEADLDLTTFQHKEYEIVTEGRFNIPYGHSFYLKNSDLIIEAEFPTDSLPAWASGVDYTVGTLVQNLNNGWQAITNHTSSLANEPPSSDWQAENDPLSNTIKLVNKKVRYVIDKPPTGPGGFLRYITGVKIIES